MRITANTHRTGAKPNNDRISDTFEIRLYATSDILGDLTVTGTIPMHIVEDDPYCAFNRTIEEFAATIAKLTKEGENCGEIHIERGTVCAIYTGRSKRHLCYYSTVEPDEIFYNILGPKMYEAYGN